MWLPFLVQFRNILLTGWYKRNATHSLLSRHHIREQAGHDKFLYGLIIAETYLYQDRHYSWSESFIKTTLPQGNNVFLRSCKLERCLPDSVFLSSPCLTTNSVFLCAQMRLHDNPALRIFDVADVLARLDSAWGQGYCLVSSVRAETSPVVGKNQAPLF